MSFTISQGEQDMKHRWCERQKTFRAWQRCGLVCGHGRTYIRYGYTCQVRSQIIADGNLDELPVSNIDIQEVPIEEVIRRIFAR